MATRKVFAWWNWRRGLLAGVVLLTLLFPLVGPETSASPREVLDLYYWYLRNFQYAKAFYLLTDNYKYKHLPEAARTNKWLYQPQTAFEKMVWGTLEINIREAAAVDKDRWVFKVELIDYNSARKVESTVTLVKANRRWEIDEIADGAPEAL